MFGVLRRGAIVIVSALPLAVVLSCDFATAPLPPGAIAFTPPSVYEWWWDQTKSCSGQSGLLSSVRWFVVPDVETIKAPDASIVAGYWSSHDNRIVLAGHQQVYGDVVRHEMLHALLGRGSHPRSAFIQNCAGVVACYGRCITDGGQAPPPDASAIYVSPSEIALTVTVTPSAPSSLTYDGHFQMMITATNASSRPVIVDLPPSGDDGPPGSFGYYIENSSGRAQWYDMRAEVPEVSRFAPNESKRFIFDLRNHDGETRYDLAPGTWTFKGRYADRYASSAPVATVSP